MNIFSILGYGLDISYRKYPVHGYFTRDDLGERYNKELIIDIFGNRFRFLRTPTYKIVISWNDVRAETYLLLELLNRLKIKYECVRGKEQIIYYSKNEDDSTRNHITMMIERLGYYLDDEYCNDGEHDKRFEYKTETFLVDDKIMKDSIILRPTK